MRRLLIYLLVLWTIASPATGVEHVTMRRDGREKHITGRLEVEAEDGGLLVLTSDGVLHAIQPEEIVNRSHDEVPFEPLDSSALGKQLLPRLPAGFKAHATAHYLICHNTSQAYGDWCGALFERLYRGFTNYWSRKGLELREPEFPLVAVVFADRAAYLKYAESDLGATAGVIDAYYNLQNNRVAMYDLTGVESLRLPGSSRNSAAQINRMLAQPQAETTVANIIHEATHQIAFNCGLQTRLADIPLWVSEGLAVYFETPDLQSAKGWRTIGAVNRPRLERFREYLSSRNNNSLQTLIADDERIRDPRQALDAYAEAWAINYYLLKQKPREYVAYLKKLSQKKPMVYDDPETRVREFKEAFGDDLSRFNADFLRNMQKVK
jgi:hypothetical protein